MKTNNIISNTQPNNNTSNAQTNNNNTIQNIYNIQNIRAPYQPRGRYDYESEDVNKNDILRKIITIADSVGLRDEVDTLSSNKAINSIEAWVEAAVNILKGHNLYFFLVGTEKEYNGKTIVVLSLPKYKFCADDQDKLDKFNKNNKYHYSALPTKSVSSFEPANDDFGGI